MRSTFIRALGAVDKAEALRSAARDSASQLRFDIGPDELSKVPGSPLAYWLPSRLLESFSSHPPLHSGSVAVWSTNPLNDDFRYARCSWEVEASKKRSLWWPWAKGGDFARFYQDQPMVICFDRRTLGYPAFLGTPSRPLPRPASVQHFFKPGLTWSRRSQKGLSVRALPSECVFGDKGPFIGVNGDEPRLLALLAIANSSTFRALVGAQMAFGSFEVGVLQRTPVPVVDAEISARLEQECKRAWSLLRRLDSSTEGSSAFVAPVLIASVDASFSCATTAADECLADVMSEISGAESEIEQLCFALYGISPDDRHAIADGFGADDIGDDGGIDGVGSESDEGWPGGEQPADLAAGLVSWCVGVGVGRFDVRLATGEREWPVEPDPFDPLPVCSPGMLTGEDGLPLEVPPEGYPVEVSPVLVDDPGHRLDITARVRSVFDLIFDEPDAWWTDVGEELGAKRGEIGSWLSKGFFDHHLKTYSKSRRKAPILWPLGTASGSYVVWLYAHRVTSDSLFRVLNDVVSPKLGVERRGLSELVQEAGPNPSAGERKAIDAQEKLVGELEELVEQLSGVAPLWQPDLNDGVVIVLAPLWRLFVHHKAWSKELRKHWDSLVAGEYDWAQLAMHLWPERVVPKCVDDRSLAIAHGLEEVFWVQDDDNPDKWHPRQTPTVPVEDLIAERTDPATKAALEDAT